LSIKFLKSSEKAEFLFRQELLLTDNKCVRRRALDTTIKIKQADLEALQQTEGIDKEVAENIYKYFHP
jgi:hypothetical protein